MSDLFFNKLSHLLGFSDLFIHTIAGMLSGLVIIAAGYVVKYLLNSFVRKVIVRTHTSVDDTILDILVDNTVALASIIGLRSWIQQIQKGLTKSDSSALTFLDYSESALYVITAFLITSIVVKIVRAIVSNSLSTLAKKNDYEGYGQTLPLLTNRVLSFVMYAIAAIVVLDRFGLNIASILTILGAGSLAVGLAAQDTISNMISGYVIMIDRPFRVGDRIRIPTGEIGEVYEIGLRSTKILDFDNNLVIVPNNDLVRTRIMNYGYPADEVRVTVEISVAYGADVDTVKRIMIKAARAHSEVLPEPPPEAFLMKLADWSLNFSLFCRIRDFKLQFKTAEELRIRIYNDLIAANIDIPYPQQVIHLSKQSHNALHPSPKRKKISR
jgi:MscS family membrane protein